MKEQIEQLLNELSLININKTRIEKEEKELRETLKEILIENTDGSYKNDYATASVSPRLTVKIKNEKALLLELKEKKMKNFITEKVDTKIKNMVINGKFESDNLDVESSEVLTLRFN